MGLCKQYRRTRILSDELVAHACIPAGNTSLELDCTPPPGGHSSVIEILWNGTFFGWSRGCHDDSRSCCPENTPCMVPVSESEHPVHWDEINSCNGKTTCSVDVEQVKAPPCHKTIPRESDYENVTYMCRCVQSGLVMLFFLMFVCLCAPIVARWATNNNNDSNNKQKVLYLIII